MFPYVVRIPGVGKVRGFKGQMETITYEENEDSLGVKLMYEQLMQLAGFIKI